MLKDSTNLRITILLQIVFCCLDLTATTTNSNLNRFEEVSPGVFHHVKNRALHDFLVIIESLEPGFRTQTEDALLEFIDSLPMSIPPP